MCRLSTANPEWFKSESFLQYRISKENKKTISTYLIPVSKEIFNNSQIKSLLSDFKTLLLSLKLFNSNLDSSSLIEENKSINYFVNLINNEIVGDNWRDLNRFFHNLYAGEISLGLNPSSNKFKSIAITFPEMGGFWDVLFCVKLFYSLRERLGNSVDIKIGVVAGKSWAKLCAIGFDMSSCSLVTFNSPMSADVLLKFKHRGDLHNFKFKLRIDLNELDYDSDSNFSFGFSKNSFGILKHIPKFDSKPIFSKFLKKQVVTESRIKVFENLHKSVFYPSTVDSALPFYLFYTSLALRAREKMDKDFVLFFIVPKDDAIGRTRLNLFLKHFSDNSTFLDWDLDPLLESSVFRSEGFNNVYTLFKEGKKVHLVFVESVSHLEFLSLLKESDLPVGITGDQSLSEALVLQKPFFYILASWKKNLFESLTNLFENLGSEELSKYFNASSFLLSGFGLCKFGKPLNLPPKFHYYLNSFRGLSKLFYDKKLQAEFMSVEKKITDVNFSTDYLLKEISLRWDELKTTE